MTITDYPFDLLWQQIQTQHRHDALTDSTNTQLITAIAQGKCDHGKWHLFTADTQTAGRGQHGRSWVSAGGNVFLSVYVPMQGQTDGLGLVRLTGMVSLLVGFYLAKMPVITQINAARAAQNLSKIGVKWANDIGHYDDERHLFQKLAGILIEPVFTQIQQKSTLAGVVVGVGLNVKNCPTIADGLYQASSLKALWQVDLGQLPDADELYRPICQAIYQAIYRHNQITHAQDNHAQDGQDATAMAAFITAFNDAHVLMGRDVCIYARDDMQRVSQSGRCLGINEQGALLLKNANGVETVFAGMVQVADDIENG
ncbi:biotin--[acetyl-CoA-carboxylase] ligase [Moraxella marmotae]|uniref:biotin--[acetyl-CoA-carboxylase] ligase n=1 Tax=Moraxella marmotae TaxID=3344520 RepID=UPI0035F389F2